MGLDRYLFTRRAVLYYVGKFIPTMIGIGMGLAACVSRMVVPVSPILVNGVWHPSGMEAEPLPKEAKIETTDHEAVVVVGQDALLLRKATQLEMVSNPLRIEQIALLHGGVLSVFGKGSRVMKTPNAVIGVRGTGLYVEVEPTRTYVCLCYGTIELSSRSDPEQRQTLQTHHHEAPRFVAGKDVSHPIQSAPMINHTDAELIMLESLVGRVPPFVTDRQHTGSRY